MVRRKRDGKNLAGKSYNVQLVRERDASTCQQYHADRMVVSIQLVGNIATIFTDPMQASFTPKLLYLKKGHARMQAKLA